MSYSFISSFPRSNVTLYINLFWRPYWTRMAQILRRTLFFSVLAAREMQLIDVSSN